MTMFGTIVQRLTSPMTSPSSCRRFKPSPRWEIQSDPEDDSIVPVRKSHAKDFLNKRRSKSHARCLNVSDPEPCENVLTWQDIAFPHLCETKSLGRLDGIREVQRLVDYECYLREAKNLIEDENQVETNSILQSNQLEGDLHRIQELFPGDNLRLHERDILTTNVTRRPECYNQITIFWRSFAIFQQYSMYFSIGNYYQITTTRANWGSGLSVLSKFYKMTSNGLAY